MDSDDQTIVEQEVQEFAALAGAQLRRVYDWLDVNLFTLESIYQLAAIGVTLALAWLLHSRVKRLLEDAGRERNLGHALQRLVRTVAAISLSVVWVVFLGITISIFEGLEWPIQFLRLVSSLLLAFIAINIVSIFIASAYWSRVFSWVAWVAAALNAVGLLDIVIEWLRATGVTIGAVNITAWSIVKALMLAALLVWGANAVAAAVERQLQKSRKMSSGAQASGGQASASGPALSGRDRRPVGGRHRPHRLRHLFGCGRGRGRSWPAAHLREPDRELYALGR